MKMNRHCHICILQQIVRAATHLGLDDSKQEEVYGRVLMRTAGMDYRKCTAPEFASVAHGVLSGMTGDPDPYATAKREQNQMILDRLDYFRSRISAATDPLAAAAKYALMGNIIDLGAAQLFDTESVFNDPENFPVGPDDLERLRRILQKGRRLLVIGDNAGEAVLDRLFIAEIRREYPQLQVGYAVRSRPAINDVIATDARHAGLDKVAEIMPSGSACAGTLLSHATPQFSEWFHGADAVVAKGQGNFETLENAQRPVVFMFRVKCDVVARFVGLPLDTPIMAFRDSLPTGDGACKYVNTDS
ncbi:MAG TPA: DUF89 family protein [Candidatus Aminicenantes bacterium]|nr:DUF89 family protein [Candidatus Aminicenantes bacterium]